MKKRGVFFPPSSLTEAVHRWVGPDRAGLHQWRIEQAAGGEAGLVGISVSQTSEAFTFLIPVSLNICTRPTELRAEFQPCCS